MYSPHNSYGSPPPELSNNPFIDHPSNALARYPDISGSSDFSGASPPYSSLSQASTPGPNPGAAGYGPQNPSGYGGGYQQQMSLQPQQTSWGGGSEFMQPQQPQSYAAQTPQMTGRPFQPSSSFGQQLAGQINGAYGIQQQPQQPPSMQPQYSGYPTSPQYGPGGGYGFPPQQQQQQQSNQYLAEFDPYAQQQPGSSYAGTPSATGAAGGYRPPHPREYVQQHKAELEAWDTYAWKQMQQSFDALKDAWFSRKSEIEVRARAMGGAGLFGGDNMYGNAYGGQAQEYMRFESLAKEAESNFNSVAASAFQMQEVHSGYRQSGDIASKRRVREAINAALTTLPDWPPQGF